MSHLQQARRELKVCKAHCYVQSPFNFRLQTYCRRSILPDHTPGMNDITQLKISTRGLRLLSRCPVQQPRAESLKHPVHITAHQTNSCLSCIRVFVHTCPLFRAMHALHVIAAERSPTLNFASRVIRKQRNKSRPAPELLLSTSHRTYVCEILILVAPAALCGRRAHRLSTEVIFLPQLFIFLHKSSSRHKRYTRIGD